MLQQDLKRGPGFSTLLEIRWEFPVALNAPGSEPCSARGWDAQGDISGKTPAVHRKLLPIDLPVVPELLEGTVAQK